MHLASLGDLTIFLQRRQNNNVKVQPKKTLFFVIFNLLKKTFFAHFHVYDNFCDD
jgi:hypothetical protein